MTKQTLASAGLKALYFSGVSYQTNSFKASSLILLYEYGVQYILRVCTND